MHYKYIFSCSYSEKQFFGSGNPVTFPKIFDVLSIISKLDNNPYGVLQQ